MKKLSFSLLGLALVVFSPASLVLAQSAGQTEIGINKVFQSADQSGLSYVPIYNIIQNTMWWLLAILGFLAIIGFVIAGIMYLTAAGNEDQIDRAKNATKYSIIGIIVALIGLVILTAIDQWLRTSDFF